MIELFHGERVGRGGDVESPAGSHLVHRTRWLGPDSGCRSGSMWTPGALLGTINNIWWWIGWKGWGRWKYQGWLFNFWLKQQGSCTWKEDREEGVWRRISKLRFRYFQFKILSEQSTDDSRQVFGFEYETNNPFSKYGLILHSLFYWLLLICGC